MKAPQDGTPPNPVPCGRLPDDDAASQPADGLLVILAVAIPEEHEISEQRLPLAFRHGYLEPPRTVVFLFPSRIRIWIVGARTLDTDLEDECGKDTLDFGLEARKGLVGGPESSMTAFVECVGGEIVEDGAGLFRDAPGLGEGVIEHVIDVHAMVV